LSERDVIFLQVSYDSLGRLQGDGRSEKEPDLLYSALREVVGSEATLVVPSFSLSFERNEDFDVEHTPSVHGKWSTSLDFVEFFRRLPGVVRSGDPNCSVAALGPKAKDLLEGLPNTTFGVDCMYDRLLKAGGKICCIGARLADTPFLHYAEEISGVPFRYKKLFTGRISQSGNSRKQGWITSVPIESANGMSDGSRVEGIARSEGLLSSANVGAGEVVSVDCEVFFQLLKREISHDPWITARGPASDPIELENSRTHAKAYDIQLSENASMEELISRLWRLPRDIISDGYDSALHALSTQVPMVIHEYPTGTECWTWIIPEKWTCHEAWVETLDGRRLFSYDENPLHVASYSLPLDRVVSRDELLAHLHVHPKLPDAIPFVFNYYERTWGLCCSQSLKKTLVDEQYRVRIRSDSSYGTLKVGEVVVPGRSRESFVLCAHLCHPAMVNDDLSGVVVGIKVMQALLQKAGLRYTYRFLILPETIGSVAYLSHQKELVKEMVGGLFLEMLGLDNPHALQLSFTGDSEADRCLSSALREADPSGWIGAFRTVVGNDERQFNAPGVRVPMLSLSRVMPRGSSDWPYYPEYHSSADTPERASPKSLAESRDLVLKMIDAFEGSRVPRNLYQGEVFCSRFGLNVNVYKDPEGNRALFDIIFLIDGTKSVAEIARICGISFESANRVVEELFRLGLVDYVA
jgi:aminopeptidase-like protein/aminoglycoside N3'-acetyltransferase